MEYFEKQHIIQVVNLIELSEILADQKNNIQELESARKIEKYGNITFKKLKGKTRIFVSVELGKKIIKQVHDYYGHIGVPQLCKMIRPYYYFKNFDILVRKFCKSFSVCMENKVRRSRFIGLMSKLGPAQEPYEIMSIDTVGGFGNNRGKKIYAYSNRSF